MTETDILLAYQRAAQRAQDLKWRAAVERVRVRATLSPSDNAIERVALVLVHTTLDALLAAMEAK